MSRSRVSYVSRKKRCVSSSTIGTSRPSSETMWTSTDDCFCHEQVRQSLSPYSSCAQRSRSSADISSTWGSGSGGAVAKEHLLQRVGAKAAAKRLERDGFLGWDVPEVHGRPETLHEPGLRGVGRRLEDDVVEVDGRADLLDQVGPHGAVRPEDPGACALAGFGDHLPGAGVELLAEPLRPLLGSELDGGILRPNLGEDREVASQVCDELQLLLARNLDGAVRDLDVVEAELAEPLLVALQLAGGPHGLEERPAHDDPLLPEHVELLPEVGRYEGRAPAELDDVDVETARLEHVLPGARPKTLVEDVRQPGFGGVKAQQVSSPDACWRPRSRRGTSSCRGSRSRPRVARSP